MLFYLIKNIDQKFCNGVVIESDNHIYGARLSGSDGVDDPARVMPMEINNNGGSVDQIISSDDNNRKMITFKKGDPGYMEAVLNKIKSPLKFFKRGKVIKLNSPQIITKQLWAFFADPEADVPGYQIL